MTYDFKRILESKKALRRKLARLSVAEKLSMLNKLRERELAIRGAVGAHHQLIVRESRAEYRSEKIKKGSKQA